jgi:hypothetical protein
MCVTRYEAENMLCIKCCAVFKQGSFGIAYCVWALQLLCVGTKMGIMLLKNMS